MRPWARPGAARRARAHRVPWTRWQWQSAGCWLSGAHRLTPAPPSPTPRGARTLSARTVRSPTRRWWCTCHASTRTSSGSPTESPGAGPEVRAWPRARRGGVGSRRTRCRCSLHASTRRRWCCGWPTLSYPCMRAPGCHTSPPQGPRWRNVRVQPPRQSHCSQDRSTPPSRVGGCTLWVRVRVLSPRETTRRGTSSSTRTSSRARSSALGAGAAEEAAGGATRRRARSRATCPPPSRTARQAPHSRHACCSTYSIRCTQWRSPPQPPSRRRQQRPSLPARRRPRVTLQSHSSTGRQ
mmetsp:Transcript_24939/g.63244  ORF Transcript_24939/g.63244 Transcript_24939/m.63244 type:complete len:296 (+) Transcript_24939:1027-1914(+)